MSNRDFHGLAVGSVGMTNRLLKNGSAVFLAAFPGVFSAGAQNFDADRWLSYEVGPAVILPKVGTGFSYDSDVFMGTTPSKQSDLIFMTRPEVEALFGATDLSNLRFSYAPTYLKYFDTDLLTRVDHTGSMTLRIERPKTTITGSTTVNYLGGLLGSFENFTTNPTRRLTHNHNYRLLQNISGKVSGSLAFSYGVQDYADGSPILDVTDWRVTGGTVYDLSAKMDLIGEVFYGQSSATSNNNAAINRGGDASRIGFFLGADAEFTPKLTGEVRIGYQTFEFDGTSTSSSGISAEAELNYELSAMSKVGLLFSRGIQQSVQQGDTSFVYTDIGVNYAQMLDAAGRWGFDTSVRYRNSEFDGTFFQGRSDNFFTYSAGVSYFVNDWLRAGLTYSYSDFSTNTNGAFEYDVHRVGLNVMVGY